jgi:hypothetical protein
MTTTTRPPYPPQTNPQHSYPHNTLSVTREPPAISSWHTHTSSTNKSTTTPSPSKSPTAQSYDPLTHATWTFPDSHSWPRAPTSCPDSPNHHSSPSAHSATQGAQRRSQKLHATSGTSNALSCRVNGTPAPICGDYPSHPQPRPSHPQPHPSHPHSQPHHYPQPSHHIRIKTSTQSHTSKKG